MQRTAIGFGTVLFLMGIGFYLNAAPDNRSFTALIPSLIGVVIGVCGMLAQNEVRRKTAMHIAAGVALFGVVGSLMRIVPALMRGTFQSSFASTAQILTALLCGVFLILCVQSFKAARRNAAR